MMMMMMMMYASNSQMKETFVDTDLFQADPSLNKSLWKVKGYLHIRKRRKKLQNSLHL